MKPLEKEILKGYELQFSFWPKPAYDVISISLDAFERDKMLKIVMITVEGRVLQSKTILPQTKWQQVQLDVSKNSSGYYLLKAHQGHLTQINGL